MALRRPGCDGGSAIGLPDIHVPDLNVGLPEAEVILPGQLLSNAGNLCRHELPRRGTAFHFIVDDGEQFQVSHHLRGQIEG